MHKTKRLFGRPATFVVALASLLLCGCLRRTLVTGLSETEAREVAVALYKGDLRPYVEKEPKGRSSQEQEKWQVDVPGGDRTQVEAWRILQENGLPRHEEQGIEEVYKDSQLIPTGSEERAKFLLALSGELSRSLKAIPGVVDARVHVVVPETGVLRNPDETPHATASVLITHWANYDPPKEEKLKELVANGVEGLDPKNISVMTSRLQPPARSPQDDLRKFVFPTMGQIADYAFLAADILGVAFAVWLAFIIAPGLIRWVRSSWEVLRES